MRGFLFKLVTQIFAVQIAAANFLHQVTLSVLGNVGYFLMKLIDGKRLEVYNILLQEATTEDNELERQNMELRLLSSASQVRDHAKENDDWTDRHTEALNAIGDALVGEMGWEEENVHQYLKSVVESIDGLEYDTDDW